MLEVLFLTYLGVSLSIRIAQYILTYFSPYSEFQNVITSFGKRTEEEPFVSIHLPISSEPPEVVIRTIESLMRIDYDNYEIIVLDNNTPDDRLWKPVEGFCRGKERIRFIHISSLDGNKAGALNKCTDYMDKRSEYILVVDADYEVRPEILNVCVNFAGDKGTDLLQFPQSYRNTLHTSTLNLEFSSYFKIFMNMANWFNCVLSTGTLSFIRYEALKNIGGWDGGTLTEDAELGVRLLMSGYQTLYIDEEMGRGLTPFDYQSLDKQRRRWVTGNIQVLKKYFTELFRNPMLNLKQKAGIFLQLTAWVDFKVIALLVFSLMLMQGISQGAIMVFWLYFLGMILLKIQMYKNTFKYISLKEALEVLTINQSMIISSGLSWMKAFFPIDLKFEVTRKEKVKKPTDLYLESNITGLLLYSLMILLSLSQDILSALLIAGVLVLQMWSRYHTKNYFTKLNK